VVGDDGVLLALLLLSREIELSPAIARLVEIGGSALDDVV
jgi:hypothetical protein